MVNFVKNILKLKKLAIFVSSSLTDQIVKELMKKIITYILVICTFFACKEESKTTREEATQNKEEFLEKNKLNIPKKGKLKGLNTVQEKLVQDWIQFKTVSESMKLINTSSRFAIVEDLGQLASNIDSVELKKYPEKLDVMQIRSRFLVLKTKALKLQDDATDEGFSNDEISKEIVAMNTVFHSICNQIQQASEQDIDPDEILGNTPKKDSTVVEKSVQEVYKSTISEKPKPKPKKAFKQQIQPQKQ